MKPRPDWISGRLSTGLALAICLAEAVPAQTDPQQAIESGRQALRESGGFWGHSWYDPAADDVEAVRVRPEWDFSWLENSLDFLSVLPIETILITLGWVMLAVVLGLLAYYLIKAYLHREALASTHTCANATHVQGTTIDRVEALPAPVRDPHADFLSEAERHYRHGNLAEAIIYLFSYQLIELDKHNLLRLTKGKTNRQYLREVSRHRHTATGRSMPGMLQDSMTLFEASFFGGRAPRRDAFEACWNSLDEFRAQLDNQARVATA